MGAKSCDVNPMHLHAACTVTPSSQVICKHWKYKFMLAIAWTGKQRGLANSHGKKYTSLGKSALDMPHLLHVYFCMQSHQAVYFQWLLACCAGRDLPRIHNNVTRKRSTMNATCHTWGWRKCYNSHHAQYCTHTYRLLKSYVLYSTVYFHIPHIISPSGTPIFSCRQSTV